MMCKVLPRRTVAIFFKDERKYKNYSTVQHFDSLKTLSRTLGIPESVEFLVAFSLQNHQYTTFGNLHREKSARMLLYVVYQAKRKIRSFTFTVQTPLARFTYETLDVF